MPSIYKEALQRGVGVLVIQDGKVLVATRTDNNTIGGPGGHVEVGEGLQAAAIRETKEEFGITVTALEPIGDLPGVSNKYCKSTVYLCTQYTGTPQADGVEMIDAKFMDPRELATMDNLFEPFKESLKLLQQSNERTVAMNFSITKSTEEGLVSGWANVAIQADGSTPLDWQDDVISPDTLEKAAVSFMMDYRESGIMHAGQPVGTVVESIVLTKEKQAAMGIPEGTVPEGWFITVKVFDTDVREKVRNKTLRMFSIQGKAKRVKLH